MTPELTRLRDEQAGCYCFDERRQRGDNRKYYAFIAGFDAGAKAALSLSEELVEALEYYAHPDHYTETMRMEGLRQPGVLTEGGEMARKALSNFKARSGS